MRKMLLLACVWSLAAPAVSGWKAANPAVEAAARDPDIAAVLEEADRIDAAILAGDAKRFIASFADDAVVNSPFNSIATRNEAERRAKAGQIHYRSLDRSIEYAAKRANGEVVLMGKETYVPNPPHPLADKTVRRRTTEIWTPTPGGWRLAIRQATVFDSR